ncbi:MAG TPA: DNRLRE domain-containing protein [Desulfobacteraceae bacterium]|nr:DNRLRE domain-containing protein [Desulfobacteraceae bacterium]HPQ26901.1 DNRLRE domain-containing protein [Desulfobacteraceae bacterium]
MAEGKTGKDVVEDVVAALTRPRSKEEIFAGLYEPPKEPRIALENATYDEVQTFYEGDSKRFETIDPRSDMTDGLPVVPPTEEKILEFLKHTIHDRHKIVGRMPPLGNTFDVEKVAINGIMAGCKPEYFPILLAMAEGLCHQANNQGYHTTTAFGWMGVVSGPIAKKVGMSYQRNILNPGNPANASIGRAMNLMKLNLGGWVRGVRMIANAGNPANYTCTIAEDVEGLKWPSLAEEHGLAKGENGITIFHGMKYMDLMYSYFKNPSVYPGDWGKLRPELQNNPEQWIVDGFKACSHPAEFGVLLDKKTANQYYEEGISKEDLRLKLWNMAAVTNEWGVRNIPWYHHGIGGLMARAAGYEDWKEAPKDAIFHLPPDPKDISFIVTSNYTYLFKLTHICTVSIDKWGTGPKADAFSKAHLAAQSLDADDKGKKIVINALADSQLVLAEPDKNFGQNERMLSDLGKSRAIIKFDLSQIPVNAEIKSVGLQLGAHLVPKYGWYAGNITIGVFRLKNDWSENEVSWNFRHKGKTWDNPGGDFESKPSAIYEITPPTFGEVAAGAWICEFRDKQMKADVSDWIQNPSQNSGWLLKVVKKEKKTQIADFDAKEINDRADMFRPRLIINYTLSK